jgi:hypothetical protein
VLRNRVALPGLSQALGIHPVRDTMRELAKTSTSSTSTTGGSSAPRSAAGYRSARAGTSAPPATTGPDHHAAMLHFGRFFLGQLWDVHGRHLPTGSGAREPEPAGARRG